MPRRSPSPERPNPPRVADAETGGSTRERLRDAALKLFADKGFAGTTVGDIEGEAGLTPRAGGFYRHFQSKEEVLAAAVDAHIRETMTGQAAVLGLLPLGELRAELRLVGRWLLGALDEQRDLFRVVERDGGRFPELREYFRTHLIEAAHQAAVDFTARWAAETSHSARDPQASAAVMIGAVLNYAHARRTYGQPPLGVDPDRFIDTWVDYCHDLMTGTATST
ncbi:TetR/AcrR family transcriptional regulator [Nocardia sp. NEAU-G5]|uniref:TetR/AcrR family transcriptional regulator n=1 Tax=Nocardia albiluteola TaxID=2842303 RepID=A0ABS6ARK2_9NOCA|nr:TetR/AcrR family transcriptional regulator [Nocardia albiluteola]MBU3060518.1 TetR/AcrR family transcriptional regulator [Nocardia albiluteola]